MQSAMEILRVGFPLVCTQLEHIFEHIFVARTHLYKQFNLQMYNKFLGLYILIYQ